MPEGIPVRDPRFNAKRYEARLYEGKAPPVQESAAVCAEKVAALEGLILRFEQTHNLEQLHAITSFSSKEEREASPREQALQDLKIIDIDVKYLGPQEMVSNEKYEELKAHYKRLSQAVGMITGDPAGVLFDVVVHDR